MRREYISLSQEGKLLIIYKEGCIGKQKNAPASDGNTCESKSENYASSLYNEARGNVKCRE